MAGYACPHCGEVSDPFGAGGAEAAAKHMGMPFLRRIPLDIAIRQASDAGQPPAAFAGPQAEPFMAIAETLARWITKSRASSAGTCHFGRPLYTARRSIAQLYKPSATTPRFTLPKHALDGT